MSYHTAVVCPNWEADQDHVAIGAGELMDNLPTFCEGCGTELIAACPSCGEALRGRLEDGPITTRPFQPKSHCGDCGEALPWAG